MRRPAISLLARAACLALGLAACDGDSPGTTGSAGKLRVLLTDAPFPYDSVESVHLYVESVAAATSADTTNPAGQQWITIAEPRRTFDLLDLQSGTTAILAEGELPTGEYRAVRLVLDTDRSSVIDKRGRSMQVQWQSSQGRIALHALVEDAVDAAAGGSIVIDIDVGRSFVCPYDQCGTNRIFIPRFRAVKAAATGASSGRVTRDSTNDLGRPRENATGTVLGNVGGGDSDYVVGTGATNAEGRYKVAFLRPGQYKVRVDPPRGASVGAFVKSGVGVTAGAETNGVDVLLQPQTATTALLLNVEGSPTVQVGDSVHFGTYVWRPGPDSVVQSWTAAWTSSAPSVASVGATSATRGAAVGLTPGIATITATVQGFGAASTLITVVPRRTVDQVVLNVPRATVPVGDSVIAVASGKDASGDPVYGAAFSFTVSDSTVVQPRGVYSGMYFLGTAKKRGTVTITATNGAKSASGTVTVQ